MKAAFIEQFGGPEVLKYGDLPNPVAATGEVLVNVVAASVNGADWKVRSANIRKPRFPWCSVGIFPAWSPRQRWASMI